jgi:hypothetical protein
MSPPPPWMPSLSTRALANEVQCGFIRSSTKTVVILDSDLDSTHPMEAVLNRRGYYIFGSAGSNNLLNAPPPSFIW